MTTGEVKALRERLASADGTTYNAAYDAQADYAEIARDAVALAERYERDALRYQWLRDRPGAKSEDGYGLLVVTDEPNRIPRYLGPIFNDLLDASIDAAIAAEVRRLQELVKEVELESLNIRSLYED